MSDPMRALSLLSLIAVACVVGISSAALTLKTSIKKGAAQAELAELLELERSLTLLDRIRVLSEEEEEGAAAEPPPEPEAPDTAAADRAVRWHALMRLGTSYRLAGLRGTMP